MPNFAEGGADPGGRRDRRPLTGHAGEVTKKKKEARDELIEIEPPAFTGIKHGGTRKLMSRETDATEFTEDRTAYDSFISEIGGLRLSSITPQRSSTNGITAPPGKKRYWGCVSDWEKEELNAVPDIWISTTCRDCLLNDIVCSGWERENSFRPPGLPGEPSPTHCRWYHEPRFRCSECVGHHRPCLRMVEYSANMPISKVTEKLEASWKMRKETVLEIPLHREPLVQDQPILQSDFADRSTDDNGTQDENGQSAKHDCPEAQSSRMAASQDIHRSSTCEMVDGINVGPMALRPCLSMIQANNINEKSASQNTASKETLYDKFRRKKLLRLLHAAYRDEIEKTYLYM